MTKAPTIGAPAFAQPLMVGQYNRPSWERYAAAMKGIFARRYYTNHGPLAREFEQRLQTFLGVRHAVCVTNPAIGMMMACEALAIGGSVLTPGVGTLALEHALAWCGIEPAFCDIDLASGQISLEQAVERADAPVVHAIVGANLWGGACGAQALAGLASLHDIPIVFDSAHAFGCEIDGVKADRFGLLEVFAFNETDILNAAGSACVATDNDDIAARLRNIRSSYGAGRTVNVVKTSNGRISEAQAAMGLLSLDDYAANRAHNRALFDAYRAHLGRIPGMRIIEPAGVRVSNHQMLVCELDERVFGLSRASLIAALQRENIEACALRAAHGALRQAERLPASRQLNTAWLALPLGSHVSQAMIGTVCEIIAQAPARERIPGAAA
jgi:dTDP-4-amino-4,6-dideoxygalactose transaminase